MTYPIVLALLAEMKSQRISATDIAMRAGYDRKTLTDLKHGRHSTRVSTLRDLGAVLGLELTWRRCDGAVDRVDCSDQQTGL